MSRHHWIEAGVLLFWFAAAGTAVALDPSKAITQYALDHWGPRDGLTQSAIQAIAQTPDGYLWLGTRGGLVRFDGVRFRLFDAGNTPEIAHNNIMALTVGGDGALWIGALEGGLTRLKNGRFSRLTTRDGLSSNAVRSLLTASDGSIWVGTFCAGLTRIQNGRCTRHNPTGGLSDATVRAIYQSRTGALWAGTDQGLFCLRNGRWLQYEPGGPLSNLLISTLCEDGAGTLWVGTMDDGVYRCRNGHAALVPTDNSLLSRMVRTVYHDRDGNVWIGTAAGLSRWREPHLEFLDATHWLPHSYVRCLYEDREGSLWVGLLGGGLGRLKSTTVTLYTTKEGLSSDYVGSVLGMRGSGVWVAGADRGLDRLWNGKVFRYGPADGLASNLIRGIAEAPDGSAWFGTRDGVVRWRNGRFTKYPLVGGSLQSTARAIAVDRAGTVWVAIDDGLAVVEGGHCRPYHPVSGELPYGVWTLLPARDGGLWIGTDSGLGYLRSGRWQPTGGRLPRVWAIHEAADGTLWLGTNAKGLVRVEKGSAVVYTTRDGLIDDTIYQILEDGRGNFWMSSRRGIFRIARKALDDFAKRRANSIACRSFGVPDGMATPECSNGQPASWAAPDGRLWFTTVKGLAVVNPQRIMANPLPPGVLIEEVVAGSRRLEPAASLELPSQARNIEFHYTALSLLAPEHVRFRYKLEGFDRDWVDAGTRRAAFYTNLPARTYRFRVTACNNDGLWNQTGASVGLKLTRTFRESPYYYAIPGLIILLGLFSFHRLRLRFARTRAHRAAIERAFSELEVRVCERTTELETANQALQTELGTRRRLESQLAQAQKLESLGRLAGGVAHDFNNLLTVINGYSEMLQRKFDPDDPRRRTTQEILKAGERAAVLTRQLLTFSRRIPLQPGIVDLNVVLRDLDRILRRLIGEHIDTQLVLDPALGRIYADRGQIEQVVINLAVNARDAMPRGGSLTIRTSNVDLDQAHVDNHPEAQPGPHILLEVADTGTGMDEATKARIFEPFFTTKEVGKGAGLGLSAAYGIVGESGGHMVVLSKPGGGATFQLYFPQFAASSAPDAASGLSEGSETILLVEDRPDVRSVAKEILTSKGYHVLEAAGGKEALAIVADFQEPIHLVLTDVIMPGMTGRELADRLKTLRPSTKILFMSGYTDEVITHLGELDRDVAYLQKPFTPDTLIRKVRQVLASSTCGAGEGV
jgi:ligand-binding sensor domain-containing protein/signal transduction histidine kinase/ActR/RegA family two-component response regulator